MSAATCIRNEVGEKQTPTVSIKHENSDGDSLNLKYNPTMAVGRTYVQYVSMVCSITGQMKYNTGLRKEWNLKDRHSRMKAIAGVDLENTKLSAPNMFAQCKRPSGWDK